MILHLRAVITRDAAGAERVKDSSSRVNASRRVVEIRPGNTPTTIQISGTFIRLGKNVE